MATEIIGLDEIIASQAAKEVSVANNLTGQVFGRLTVIERCAIKERSRIRYKWHCICNCGKETLVEASHLMRGVVKSCGCYARQKMTTHGQSHTKAHRIWIAMRNRCLNPNNASYADYGGRGIKICARWDSYEAFVEDMGQPEGSMQIDRINNDGNYEPSNCRWATIKDQSRNRRTTKRIVYKGRALCITEWADMTGISANVLRKRLYEYGWPMEEAFTTPTLIYRKALPK